MRTLSSGSECWSGTMSVSTEDPGAKSRITAGVDGTLQGLYPHVKSWKVGKRQRPQIYPHIREPGSRCKMDGLPIQSQQQRQVMQHQKGSSDFPDGPGVKIPCFQSRGHGFNPRWGELRSCMLHSMAKKKRKKNKGQLGRPLPLG